MGLDAGRTGGYVAGLLFGVGWWLFIDGVAFASHTDSQIPFKFVQTLPGLLSTLSFLLINTVDWEMLSNSRAYSDDTACRARTFVLFCVALSIGAFVGSILVLTHYYVDNPFLESTWPGVAVLLQNVLILLATVSMRVGLISSALY